MLITWQHHDFSLLELDDRQLVDTCFNPLIQAFKQVRIHNGDEAAFYDELTRGQQALFIFRVYYDHAMVSQEELYWWSAYFYAQPRKWSALKRGIEYLHAEDAFQLVTDIEHLLATREFPRQIDNFTITMKDLESDPPLLTAFEHYYTKFQQLSDAAIQHAAQYIRGNLDEFVQRTSDS
ncbi:hypothetical protein [Paenibacillus arenosi]|uniref:DUF4375 domain-containing protein n=1 Tax=Paenibacillus arenosi TaxID=2774142 RepID=A0ABR9AX24_9BACL|nr:hypothetical protein [Paenibacillus arenosi]MBD8497511.1 hypothetical protein [Paenibacillus arenosi]